MRKSMEMPGIEPGASYMQSKRSTTELHPHLILTSAIIMPYRNQQVSQINMPDCNVLLFWKIGNLYLIYYVWYSHCSAAVLLVISINKCKSHVVRSGIRTHAHRSGLRPERSALDRSAILTVLVPLGRSTHYLVSGYKKTGWFVFLSNLGAFLPLFSCCPIGYLYQQV